MAVVDIFRNLQEELQNPETRMSWLWWSFLSLASIFNIYQLAKLLSGRANRPDSQSPRERAYRNWMKLVATCYVVACSFRSFFPVVYAHRRCFFSFQSPAVNRGLAFIAEVSLPIGVSAAFKFVSSSLKEWNYLSPRKSDRALVERLKVSVEKCEMNYVSGLIFNLGDRFLDFSILLILFANICCNLGTISKNHWWYVIEESCWLVYLFGTSLLQIFLSIHLSKAVSPPEQSKLSRAAESDLTNLKRLNIMAFLTNVGGCLLTGFNDLPELVALALKDCNQLFCPEMFNFDFIAGLDDARSCSVLSRDWEMWSYAASWQTPYFTLCVWALIAFAFCPGTEIFRTKCVS